MKAKKIGIDIGMTNIDLVVETDGDIAFKMLRNDAITAEDQIRQALDAVPDTPEPGMMIGVTGGRYRDLPEFLDGYAIRKVDEMLAVGLGGLALAGLGSALVVSAGTGTSMVAARGRDVRHVTGSAVGGGTLLGLTKLILGTDDVVEIDQLALAGDAAAVDIMLTEAVGGQVGRLPAKANAVNLGKLGRGDDFSRADLAAGLVRLVAQVISVIAINAAAAEELADIVMVGHLMDLESVCREIVLVGEFYNQDFIIPDDPGFGTARGILAALI